MTIRPNIRKWCGRCVEAMAGLALWMAVPASAIEATTVADEAQGADRPNGARNEPGSVLTVAVDLAGVALATDDVLGPLPVE